MKYDNAIHIIITGGTIDSHYDGSKDTVIPNDTSVIPHFVESLKLYQGKFEFTTVCMKDSRQLNESDRATILKTIQESPYTKVLITQGTYTLADTARFIKGSMEGTDKVVVLTASMIPLVGFSPSDAPFNLGFAIAKLDDLPAGVYVCVNGHVFNPDEVVKDVPEGRFTSLFNR
ncbi:MAG: asparaginase domain-containing protein [Patescibacteria group bacterium]|jgi:L-asparaginase